MKLNSVDSRTLNESELIKTSFKRNKNALEPEPEFGKEKCVTKVKLENGFKCIIEGNGWEIISDLEKNSGGKNEGPNPGVLACGAFGSCIAMDYKILAAQMGIKINNISITIEAVPDEHKEDHNISTSYSIIKYEVELESDSDYEDVLRVLDLAEVRSSIHNLYKFGTHIARKVKINEGKMIK
ncbi:MAG TPA: OsmC family protein [Ignavibacteriaceae bacterium]|nr:OsmC family protein [Ignavibacteriaceae bacterium]